jgi:hypothetical protein
VDEETELALLELDFEVYFQVCERQTSPGRTKGPVSSEEFREIEAAAAKRLREEHRSQREWEQSK